LEDALEKAKQANIPIPERHWTLLSNPRLFSSIGGFRDAIRRQFNYQEFLINIRSIQLSYKKLNIQDQQEMYLDVHRRPWHEARSIFESPLYSGFILLVTFESVDDLEVSTYESFEPLPEIADLFKTSGGDITVNEADIADIITSAFSGDSTASAPAPASVSTGTTEPTNPTLSFLDDMPFNHHGSANEIGSAPNLMKRFGKNKPAMIKYYNGFDVTIPAEKRKWQDMILNEVSENGTIASVKIDKIAKDLKLTAAEQAAVEEGESRGRHLAIAQETMSIDKPQAEDVSRLIPLKKNFPILTYLGRCIL
jgi:hypothetical protein